MSGCGNPSPTDGAAITAGSFVIGYGQTTGVAKHSRKDKNIVKAIAAARAAMTARCLSS
jgi:hypothetical protein